MHCPNTVRRLHSSNEVKVFEVGKVVEIVKVRELLFPTCTSNQFEILMCIFPSQSMSWRI